MPNVSCIKPTWNQLWTKRILLFIAISVQRTLANARKRLGSVVRATLIPLAGFISLGVIDGHQHPWTRLWAIPKCGSARIVGESVFSHSICLLTFDIVPWTLVAYVHRCNSCLTLTRKTRWTDPETHRSCSNISSNIRRV